MGVTGRLFQAEWKTLVYVYEMLVLPESKAGEIVTFMCFVVSLFFCCNISHSDKVEMGRLGNFAMFLFGFIHTHTHLIFT